MRDFLQPVLAHERGLLSLAHSKTANVVPKSDGHSPLDLELEATKASCREAWT